MQQPNLALTAIQESLPPTKHKRSTDEIFSEPQRLHKVLASCGFGSRRAMEDMIIAGRITVNRLPAEVGQKVGPGDEVRINGELVKVRFTEPRPRILMYHKPAGEIVSRDDPEGRPTVFTRLPNIGNGKWINVGRLDFNTEGLLLFTNAGELANRLMHPRYEVEREYAVRVMGRMTDEQMAMLVAGVQLEDGPAKCEKVEDGGGEEEGANHWYHVVLKEGRNREVRRLFEAMGLTVSRLIRTRYGTLAMPSLLKRGDLLELEPADVAAVVQAAGVVVGADGVPRVPRPQGGQPRGKHGQQQRGRRGPGGHAPRQQDNSRHGDVPPTLDSAASGAAGDAGEAMPAADGAPFVDGAIGTDAGRAGEGARQGPPRPHGKQGGRHHGKGGPRQHGHGGQRPPGQGGGPRPEGQGGPRGEGQGGPRPEGQGGGRRHGQGGGPRPQGQGGQRPHGQGGQRPHGQGGGPRPQGQGGGRPDFDTVQPQSNANAIGLRPPGEHRRKNSFGGPNKGGYGGQNSGGFGGGQHAGNGPRPQRQRVDFDSQQPQSNANGFPFGAISATGSGAPRGPGGPGGNFNPRGNRNGPRGRPGGGGQGGGGQFRGKGPGNQGPRPKRDASGEANGNVAPRESGAKRAPRPDADGNVALPKPPVQHDED
jgi:23S rRNA pseudouridine2605 synthase